MSNSDLIQSVLEKTFQPEQLDIIDESHKHAGHAGARDGGGHYLVDIVYSGFEGKSRIARHRMIKDATRHLFEDNTIHALSVKARTPAETS